MLFKERGVHSISQILIKIFLYRLGLQDRLQVHHIDVMKGESEAVQMLSC